MRETSDVAFDISTGEAGDAVAASLVRFDDFYDAHANTLSVALSLACDDQQLADAATKEALIKTAHRWRTLASHPNVLGWAINVGVEYADKVVRERGPVALNEATGGYVRGLDLSNAVALLPLQQRSSLVMANYLGWSDRRVAEGMGAAIDRVVTLRTRGANFVAHHLHIAEDQAVHQITEHFAVQAEQHQANLDPSTGIRRVSRVRTIRNRALFVLAVAAAIIVGAALVQVTTRPSEQLLVEPEPITPPSNSSDWLPPVGDGSGGFVALNTSGASRFAVSDDGEVWFERAIWNSRAVDIRTEVTDLKRSGGRYIATIEAGPSIQSRVDPYIATSTDLDNWSERELPVGDPPPIDGLQIRFDVVNTAAVGTTLLVAVELDESIDYQWLGVSPNDVCAEVEYDSLRALHLCDGEVLSIDRPSPSGAIATDVTRFYLAEGPNQFEPVELPAGSDPISLGSDGSRYSVTNALTGELFTSVDGKQWIPQLSPLQPTRFVLTTTGAAQPGVLVVAPSVSGWESRRFGQFEAAVIIGEVGLNLDPSVVWSKPQLAGGPAGWALFITTSRPWDRGDASPGWAVDTGKWIVSRQPDSSIVSAIDAQTRTTYRFNDSSDLVSAGPGEGVEITFPDDPGSMVLISDEDIARSRSTGDTPDQAKAQLLFSDDGVTWRTIWESNDDAWFGSIVVGDDEVLVSGTTLIGPPIAVPIE